MSQAAIIETAPLEEAAQAFSLPLVPQLIAIGAITAMLGVLLNLLLGLSRVLMAMGRRRDMPPIVAQHKYVMTINHVHAIIRHESHDQIRNI